MGSVLHATLSMASMMNTASYLHAPHTARHRPTRASSSLSPRTSRPLLHDGRPPSPSSPSSRRQKRLETPADVRATRPCHHTPTSEPVSPWASSPSTATCAASAGAYNPVPVLLLLLLLFVFVVVVVPLLDSRLVDRSLPQSALFVLSRLARPHGAAGLHQRPSARQTAEGEEAAKAARTSASTDPIHRPWLIFGNWRQ